NLQDLWMARQLELLQDMDLQRTEAATEIDMLLRCDILLAKHQHMMLGKGLAQLSEVWFAQGAAQVKVQDFGTQRSGKGTHNIGKRVSRRNLNIARQIGKNSRHDSVP